MGARMMCENNNTVAGRSGHIESLQTVRALAFLGIFASHCGVTKLGNWGVSVFFILSGFLMVYSYYNKPLNTSFKSCLAFSLKKIKKLYPLHILMMLTALVFVAHSLILDYSVKRVILYLGQTVLNVLLLQTWVPSESVYFSLNGVAWYLSVCLFIYACFPPILKRVRGGRYPQIAAYCGKYICGTNCDWSTDTVCRRSMY